MGTDEGSVEGVAPGGAVNKLDGCPPGEGFHSGGSGGLGTRWRWLYSGIPSLQSLWCPLLHPLPRVFRHGRSGEGTGRDRLWNLWTWGFPGGPVDEKLLQPGHCRVGRAGREDARRGSFGSDIGSEADCR